MKSRKRLVISLLLISLCFAVLILVGCDNQFDNNESHEHTLVEHEGKKPTCTEGGWYLYNTCATCDDYSTYIPIAPLGHDYSDIYEPNGDVHSVVCSRCSFTIDQSHTWQEEEVISHPTCTETGLRSNVCNVCAAETTTSIPSLGHNYSENYSPNGDVHSRNCTRCTATIDQDHDWVFDKVIDAPTCSASGSERYVCTVCTATKSEILLPTGEHTYDIWNTTCEAGAFEAGLEVSVCSVCHSASTERVIPAHVTTMPILYMDGNYTAATNAKNEVKMSVVYTTPEGEILTAYALIKVQGSSSTAYPKKNYTIKFYKDEDCTSKLKIDLGWGKESKYCLKANWIDYTQARNIVSCRLWSDMVATRPVSDIQARLAGLPTNAGAIDGFPVAIYMNDEFYGLYTMNVPKDEWMFGMDDCETEALLAADDWLNTDFSVLLDGFEENSAGDYVSNNGGWELKYFGTEKTTGSTEWVTESFNDLIRFCQENDGEAFRTGISQYLDVDSAIDYLILLYAIYMRDNGSKNMLWATYDGKVWIPSVYDQDGTFGMVWDGKRYAKADEALPYVKDDGSIDANYKLGSGYFLLWDRMLNCFTEEILIRYKELREGVLSVEHIVATFEEFRACTPESIYEADFDIWADERTAWLGVDESEAEKWCTRFDWDYTYGWVEDRLDNLDLAMQDIYNNAYLPSVDTPAL